MSCASDGPQVQLFRPLGQRIGASERLTVVAMDSMIGGQFFAPLVPPGSLQVPTDAPIVREVVEDWLRGHGGHLRADDFVAVGKRRVEIADTSACLGQ